MNMQSYEYIERYVYVLLDDITRDVHEFLIFTKQSSPTFSIYLKRNELHMQIE
jgi:hypothetical protein